jgi:hypothetical protein
VSYVYWLLHYRTACAVSGRVARPFADAVAAPPTGCSTAVATKRYAPRALVAAPLRSSAIHMQKLSEFAECLLCTADQTAILDTNTQALYTLARATGRAYQPRAEVAVPGGPAAWAAGLG